MKKPYAIQITYCTGYLKSKRKTIPSYNENKEERIKVYPNEVTTNYENHNWLYGSYHTSETNDPIGTKMRISFYLCREKKRKFVSPVTKVR